MWSKGNLGQGTSYQWTKTRDTRRSKSDKSHGNHEEDSEEGKNEEEVRTGSHQGLDGEEQGKAEGVLAEGG